MKKISIFLISLTLLTFSNTASASFFKDVFKVLFGDIKKPSDIIGRTGGINAVRCKIEYTQLDLATGLEKNVKYSNRYNVRNLATGTSTLYLSAQDLTDEINVWLDESANNVITDLTIINCQEMRFFVSVDVWKSEERWEEYKGCEDKYNVELINLLNHPNLWGYIVHKERLIKDYKDGCKNYVYNPNTTVNDLE
jgi:hypothetical protein